MIFFLLPRTGIQTYKYIECTISEAPPDPIISHSLSYYLNDIKEKIDDKERDWDIYKKYTNPYEYIHTPISNKRKSISKYKPLSRSYFKMIELIHFFKLIKPVTSEIKPMKSFHLAEGPGGFIEALANMRNCPQDKYIGITILDDENDPNIPSWKKTEYFLQANPNVSIETGRDGTGNILSLENFEHCVANYASSMDLITGDGGFDFSIDFNSQEISITKLLFAQACFALALQKRGGSFVLKVFDCFMQPTVDILYLLSAFYEKVYITKPQTSRYANSEKYVVCKGFLFENCRDYYPHLRRAFDIMQKAPENAISGFLSIPLANHFLTKLQEYNAIFGQQQIETIHYTISLIENKFKTDKIENLIKNNIQKCMNWCIKHDVPYYAVTATPNIFRMSEEM